MMKSLFPVLSQYTYVDTASSGLFTDDLYAWRQKHDEEFLATGSIFGKKQGAFLESVRETVKAFFHARHAYLVPNFSYAFNLFLETLSADDRFLLLGEEYPSVSHPIVARGFDTHTLVVDEHLEERIYQAIKTYRPTVFAFSLVQYINGFALSLDFIKQLKKDFPDVLLVADGTQYCGAGTLAFGDSGLDVLAGSGYKWLLAGYGNGYILFNDEVYNRISVAFGKVTVSDEFKSRGKDAISAHFEPGHLDTLSFGTLQQSLQFLDSLGMNRVENQVQELAIQARDAFAELGLLEEAIARRNPCSSIFNIKGDSELFNTLQNEGVLCTPRGQGIRISFHFFNEKDDLDKILQIIKGNVSS